MRNEGISAGILVPCLTTDLDFRFRLVSTLIHFIQFPAWLSHINSESNLGQQPGVSDG